MAFLVIERGKEAGSRISLTEFPVSVGRDASNTVVVNDDQSSRYHLRIKKRGQLYILEDLDSRNGTYVNGDKVLNAALQSGDKILVGSTELVFLASEPNIEIASEIINFDMQVAQDLGISGPLDMRQRSTEDRAVLRPVRLDPIALASHALQDSHKIREIFDLHSNLLVISDMNEASQSVLKSIGRIIPSASRAAFFMWSASSRQLVPLASRNFKTKKKFLLSQSALEDAITRIQTILLPAKPAEGLNRQRLVLPMFHNGEVSCVIHVESDKIDKAISTSEIEVAQALLTRCSPVFESMMLRREIDSWLVGMVETMIAAVEAKDTYTRGHSERVSKYSMAIAEELRLNREIKRMLMISALCHDIGKIGIPDVILKKASLLSAEEYNEMKLHPTIGAEIINHMPNSKRIISGVKYHHEKWDGTGYPEGLIGEDIPFFGRIIAVADVFDAMVSGRAYSGFLDQGDAVDKILEEKELFCPEIIKAFVKAFENGRLTLKTSTQNQEIPTPGKEAPRIIIPELHDATSEKPKKTPKKLKKS